MPLVTSTVTGSSSGRQVGSAALQWFDRLRRVRRDEARGGAAGEGRLAAQQLVRHDPEGVEVGAVIGVGVGGSLLRRHVHHGPDGDADRGQAPAGGARGGGMWQVFHCDDLTAARRRHRVVPIVDIHNY